VTGKTQLRRAVQKKFASKADKQILIPGLLGAYIGAVWMVSVPGRPSFVYVRVHGNNSEVIEAFNDTVSPILNLAVVLTRDELTPNYYRILRRDVAKYQDWYTPQIGYHATQHEFGGTGSMGADIVWIQKQQFVPLEVRPMSVSGSTYQCFVDADYYQWNAGYQFFSGGATPDLAFLRPGGQLQGLFLGVYMNGNTDSLMYITGTQFSVSPWPDNYRSYIPAVPTSVGIPLAGILLTHEMTGINWSQICDIRPILGNGGITGSNIPLDMLLPPTDNTQLNSTTGSHGLFPKLDGNASDYLNGLGQWITLAGGGDMLKSTYDPNNDGIIGIVQGGTNATGTVQALINLGATITGSCVPIAQVTGGGVLATGGFTLTVPATGTAVLSTDKRFGTGYGLINGKIVVSVAANNLTVAIQTLAGANPSATDPVYIQIGSVMYSITAALSVTKNAATNWCNSGGAELATKEIDYFIYLGYNATDGVVVGFSRIPYAALYSDFSATTTNKNYCAISTITHAAAGDNYVNIGRFSATLSAGGGYTWSVPTFTSANLVQRPIYQTRWLTWQPVYSAGGSMTYTSVTTTLASYMISYQTLFYTISAIGTTGGTAHTDLYFTVAMSRLNTGGYENTGYGDGYDSTSAVFIPSFQFNAASTTTVRVYKPSIYGTWYIGANSSFDARGSYQV
jgi:hypothetical protein